MIIIRHGTDAGHRQHHRLGIPPCPACLQAHALYEFFRKKNRMS